MNKRLWKGIKVKHDRATVSSRGKHAFRMVVDMVSTVQDSFSALPRDQ